MRQHLLRGLLVLGCGRGLDAVEDIEGFLRPAERGQYTRQPVLDLGVESVELVGFSAVGKRGGVVVRGDVGGGAVVEVGR